MPYSQRELLQILESKAFDPVSKAKPNRYGQSDPAARYEER
jgi:hypothetical protein